MKKKKSDLSYGEEDNVLFCSLVVRVDRCEGEGPGFWSLLRGLLMHFTLNGHGMKYRSSSWSMDTEHLSFSSEASALNLGRGGKCD